MRPLLNLNRNHLKVIIISNTERAIEDLESHLPHHSIHLRHHKFGQLCNLMLLPGQLTVAAVSKQAFVTTGLRICFALFIAFDAVASSCIS